MSVKGLFEGRSHEEIEEAFDTWMKRDFEDIPVNAFFAILEEIGARRPTQYLEVVSTEASASADIEGG